MGKQPGDSASGGNDILESYQYRGLDAAVSRSRNGSTEHTYDIDYDIFGRKSAVSADAGTADELVTGYDYNSRNQLVSETQPQVDANVSTNYGYAPSQTNTTPINSLTSLDLAVGDATPAPLHEVFDYSPNNGRLHHITVGTIALEFF